MNRITKEMCISFVKDHFKAKVMMLTCCLVFLLIMLWFSTRHLMALLVSAAFAVLILSVFAFLMRKKVKDLCTGRFYVAEDVVADFKRRRSFSKNRNGYNHIYTFKEYGKYVIYKSIYPSITVGRKERYLPDETAIESNEIGDLFYLLIVEERNRKQIIKCFYRFYYDIEKADFDCIDGKYYCKRTSCAADGFC
ncbi:MAG: hypothetical protein IJY20_00665 [Clostridia bacterium]|nr:hypothetical protein [Clostridia bacterium]